MIRRDIAALGLSAAALVGLALNEDYTGHAVQPVPGDAWTVGFGTTGADIGPTTTTTPPQALVRMLRDVQQYEGALHKCVTVPLHQHEYDAYLSLAYNIGAGAFCGSTLVKLLNGADYASACEQIKRWDKFRGKPLRGLTLRRQREYAQCVGTGLT